MRDLRNRENDTNTEENTNTERELMRDKLINKVLKSIYL